ncbi:MAG: biopolymer transporter ExbD [bacterium]|nr:biopolymer transporter ExbD [bacterium]
MNLAKHDPETEMDMNMTPMIDVVFLLIIFFMVITDMTQQDLEELKLPIALSAKPDKPDPDEWRPIVNIPHTGEWIIKREAYYNPERDKGLADPYAEAKKWLVLAAGRMEKEHLNIESGTGPMIPDEALLIRADQSTQFKHIQKMMEFCGLEGIQIWKIQLAASTPEPEQ